MASFYHDASRACAYLSLRWMQWSPGMGKRRWTCIAARKSIPSHIKTTIIRKRLSSEEAKTIIFVVEVKLQLEGIYARLWKPERNKIWRNEMWVVPTWWRPSKTATPLPAARALTVSDEISDWERYWITTIWINNSNGCEWEAFRGGHSRHLIGQLLGRRLSLLLQVPVLRVVHLCSTSALTVEGGPFQCPYFSSTIFIAAIS